MAVSATYDEFGNLLELAYADGGTTSYTYDDMDRLIAEINPIGARYEYSYNERNLLLSSKNARGQETSYEYDILGRITSVKDVLGTISYSYDGNGNVLTATEEGPDGNILGTITRTFDELNRVKTYTDYKGNTVEYGYDELGNLISLEYAGGEIVRYTYYKNGLLETVTDWNGLVTSYEYDANGHMLTCSRPDGTSEECTYNNLGQPVTKRETDAAGDTILEYVYTYDAAGNLASITGTGTAGTAGISGLSSMSCTYDEANRLITFNGEKVLYDADGNMTYGPVDGRMTDLAYDCRNRLVSAGGISYTYDCEDNRLTAETDTYIEEYLTETASDELSRVLRMRRYEKQSDGKTVTDRAEETLYVYGRELISEEHDSDGKTRILYHHYNHLKSTVLLTDGEGNRVQEYTYGPYGELLSGDASLTRYLYNGGYGVSTDGNGLYYMRQRYYSPDIKRFVNMDILTGGMEDPLSLNRYSYVQGNPVSYTDPFGLSPTGETSVGLTLLHTALDIAGLVPVFGALADIANGLIYAYVDQDMSSAWLCIGEAGFSAVGAGCVSIAAKAASGSAKAGRFVKAAGYVGQITKIVENSMHLYTNSKSFINTAGSMYVKYSVNGESFSLDTAFEFANLALSAFGIYGSTRGLAGGVSELSDMWRRDDVTGKLKARFEVLKSRAKDKLSGLKSGWQGLMADNRGSVDVDALLGRNSGCNNFR